jgi:hypothetical protein
MSGNVCWRESRDLCLCDICDASDKILVAYGRCRSGKLWFWHAGVVTWGWGPSEKAHGWAPSEDEALAQAREAVVRIAAGRPARASVRHGWTSHALKEINKAKRAARPPSDATDSRVVEYLYSVDRHDEGWGSWGSSIKRYRIVKRTKARVFYARSFERIDIHGEPDPRYPPSRRFGSDEIGFVDRQKLEADGEVTNKGRHWSSDDYKLYASLDDMLARHRGPDDNPPDLAALKEAMAAAHPDRGGSNEAFIKARRIYVDARRLVRRQETQTAAEGRAQ